MTPEERRQLFAERILTEVKTGTLQWYYISVATEHGTDGQDGFRGGWVIQARGPTEAWHLLHALNAVPKGCETQTIGPIAEDIVAAIPHDQRWRKLNREEATNLGK